MLEYPFVFVFVFVCVYVCVCVCDRVCVHFVPIGYRSLTLSLNEVGGVTSKYLKIHYSKLKLALYFGLK